MVRIFGFLGLLIVLGVGFYIYTQQVKNASSAAGTSNPKAAIDVTVVRADLVAFANAEKQEYAFEGKYLSLEDLRAKGVAIPSDQRGPYHFSSDVTDSGFRITATNSDPATAGAPRSIGITEAMQIETQ